MTVFKATKKPVTIEAILLTGDNNLDALMFVDEYGAEIIEGNFFIKTLEGNMKADVGDYIIKGVKGEFYPCKPDIFLATYNINK